MKDFFRSLRYLKPYRLRLGISVVCVLIIALLWGGGLGMLAPTLKVLVDREGLHGWAWKSVVDGRLEIRSVFQELPPETSVEDIPLATALGIVEVADDGPGNRAGLTGNQWIVGLADGNPDHRVLRADDAARLLAKLPGQAQITLRLYDSATRSVQEKQVQLARAPFTARLLGRVASKIPEPESRAQRFPILVWILVALVVITVLRDLMRFFQEYLVETAVWSGIMDIRRDVYNTALRLPVTFYAQRGTSDTMSRFIQDTGELARGQVTLFGKTLVEPAKAIGSLIAALVLSWELTLIATLAGPPAFLLIRKFGKIMKRASRRALESWSLMLAVLEETLTGIRVVKTYTMESHERKRFFRENRRLLKQQRRMARIDAATAPAIEAMGVIAGSAAAGAAGYFVLNDLFDPFIFIAWMACLAALFDPVRKLAKVATRFQRADAAAGRIFELRDEPIEPRVAGAPGLARHHESLAFRDVHFRYPGASEDALKQINLDIAAGQSVAIVGPNGCGKTTLVSMVPRLFQPTAGKILIDGHDISQVSLRSLRRQVGMVTQETVLFHATIAENIAYGLRRPRREQIIEAAKKAFVDEFVRDLPEGYDTIVGEKGSTLSGGQRQRISIARAILRDPAILIFDEATSQIDADSEHRIHQAMQNFMRERTTLMIAHRFATVLAADMIVVMNAGEIVDTGPHEQLLQNCKLYAHLYRTQFVDSGG
jgi:ABC-type multidrug transport system fused ATPase/permease subunit